jgi:hypothetical protein
VFFWLAETKKERQKRESNALRVFRDPSKSGITDYSISVGYAQSSTATDRISNIVERQ